MMKKFSVTLTLVLEREVADDEEAGDVMDEAAREMTDYVGQFDGGGEIGVMSIFEIHERPEPEGPLANILQFPTKKKKKRLSKKD